MKVEVKVINESGFDLPQYATPQAAGLDLRAAITEPMTIAPGQRAIVPTGLRIALPDGYEMQLRPRSGLAIKSGITLLNSPGTIDADYRGEIGVIIINHSDKAFTIERGDRICQAVVARYEQVQWLPCSNLDATDRGEGGFGHSGVK